MPVKRKHRKSGPRGPYVKWTDRMTYDLTRMWEKHTGKAIAERLTRKYRTDITAMSVLGRGNYLKLGRKSQTSGRPRKAA